MTRDEAINKLCGRVVGEQIYAGEAAKIDLIDSLVSLGLLKLEEPKSMEQKAYDALYNAPLGTYACAPDNFIIGSREAEEIINHLARAGLTIVEK